MKEAIFHDTRIRLGAILLLPLLYLVFPHAPLSAENSPYSEPGTTRSSNTASSGIFIAISDGKKVSFADCYEWESGLQTAAIVPPGTAVPAPFGSTQNPQTPLPTQAGEIPSPVTPQTGTGTGPRTAPEQPSGTVLTGIGPSGGGTGQTGGGGTGSGATGTHSDSSDTGIGGQQIAVDAADDQTITSVTSIKYRFSHTEDSFINLELIFYRGNERIYTLPQPIRVPGSEGWKIIDADMADSHGEISFGDFPITLQAFKDISVFLLTYDDEIYQLRTGAYQIKDNQGLLSFDLASLTGSSLSRIIPNVSFELRLSRPPAAPSDVPQLETTINIVDVPGQGQTIETREFKNGVLFKLKKVTGPMTQETYYDASGNFPERIIDERRDNNGRLIHRNERNLQTNIQTRTDYFPDQEVTQIVRGRRVLSHAVTHYNSAGHPTGATETLFVESPPPEAGDRTVIRETRSYQYYGELRQPVSVIRNDEQGRRRDHTVYSYAPDGQRTGGFTHVYDPQTGSIIRTDYFDADGKVKSSEVAG